LPGIATGDFHQIEHLRTWKTLLPCVKEQEAVIDYLRSKRPGFLVALDETAVPVTASLAA
jgi:hypothetical protein